MKIPRTRTGLILGVMGLLLVAVCQQDVTTSRAQSEKKAPQEIKVGITEYQDIEKSYERYERLFQELMASVDPNEPVTFKFAIGNYGEVMDWYNKGDIDVGIFSAMPVANFLRDASGDDYNKFADAYVGDVGISTVLRQPLPLVTGTEEELAKKDPFYYRSVCLAPWSDPELGTRSDGKERTIDDIKRVKEQVKFIFVRPFSLSGYVVPLYVLKKNGINPDPKQIEFSYEHSNSVRRLLDEARNENPDPTKHYVACVLDESRYPEPIAREKMFERIRIDELQSEDFKIPREKIFVNYHMEKDKLPEGEGAENRFEKYKILMEGIVERAAERAQKAGGAITSASSSFVVKIALRPANSDGFRYYRESREAIENVALPRQLPYKSTVDKLLADFAGYVDRPTNEQVRTPRLALVLSGGGAKCAYQAGAIVEIETKLAELNEARRNHGKKPVDIDLVVGTSGGAINALLVAAGVTKPNNINANGKDRADEIASLWGSFNQLDFFRPSGRFNLVFGICFGLLQAIVITVAVLIFGRQTMHWPATIVLILGIGGAEVFAARYFLVPWETIRSALTMQAGLLAIIIVIVVFVGWIITVIVEKRWKNWRLWRWLKGRRQGQTALVETPDDGPGEKLEPLQPSETAAHHWRWLTIVLMLFVSLIEVVISYYRGFDDSISSLSDSHWMEHGWTLVRLVSSWSFPYPLLIAILMATVGAIDWNRRRETLVWLMTILLIVMAAGLMLETLFRASAPSKAEGIEQAFVQRFPQLIRNTIDGGFNPDTRNELPLQVISRELMNRKALQRDLIITTSRLPSDTMSSTVGCAEPPPTPQQQAELVNGLPEDLYFYFHAVRADKQNEIKPPVDRRFVPFKHNPDKLLDVVIGSSTIYPIFPSRILDCVVLGNEDKPSSPTITKLKIVDGGFIHNIPIEAASLWKASHIILIEASPVQQQSPPRHFFDNTLTAFGYLFSQAQRTDKLARGSAETFELRPTSRCEKQDVLPSCVGLESIPEPYMDTFDFSPNRAKNAFNSGRNDVNVKWHDGSATQKPLFVRVSGAPLFRELIPRPKAK